MFLIASYTRCPVKGPRGTLMTTMCVPGASLEQNDKNDCIPLVLVTGCIKHASFRCSIIGLS